MKLIYCIQILHYQDITLYEHKYTCYREVIS